MLTPSQINSRTETKVAEQPDQSTPTPAHLVLTTSQPQLQTSQPKSKETGSAGVTTGEAGEE